MTSLRLHVEDDGLAAAVVESLGLLKIQGVEVVSRDVPADVAIGAEARNLRLGGILDWVIARRDNPMSLLPDLLDLGPGVLALAGGTYTTKNGDMTRLTDKERDLLVALYRAPGRLVAKDDLLQQVWGYVQGLETHTLETHIYRLRQKIEVEPAVPRIILTEANAYRFVIPEE